MSIEVKMPRLSDTMEQGTVVRWAVKPGQKVKSGDVVADIETDKATMELQTFDDGTVADLAVAEGATVKVGTVIMRLAEAGETVESASKGAPSANSGSATDQRPTSSAPSSAEVARTPRPTTAAPAPVEPAKASSLAAPAASSNNRAVSQPSTTSRDRVFASPLARKLAQENNIDLGAIEGSGPSGRIVQRDVEAALSGAAPAGRAPAQTLPARRSPGDRAEPARISGLSAGAVPGTALPPIDTPLKARAIPLSNMRATIAKRLVQSKASIPHYQVTVAARMDALLSLRAQLNDQLAPQGVKLSVNDFLVRACALAMHQHPHVNSRWAEAAQGSTPAIELLPNVNVGVAIALPLNDKGEGGGLVVATLRNADRLGLRQISAETRRLGEKARAKGLSIEEMSDSTFTISNLGMFGVEHFTAIINPPNVAILAVGAAVEKPVITTDRATGKKTIAIGHEMQMTMSSDHRVVDGAMAAQYLATVKQLLEAPATLLV